MSDDPQLDYFHYLKGRSWLGWAYRHYYLYPRINRHLPGRVLDVGCGIGDFIRCHGNAVGLDVNPHTVRYCREQGLESHLIENEHYPFEDGVFDSVVLDNVLEHLPEPYSVLGEIRRVLRPAGHLVVGVPGRKGYAADPDHKKFYDAEILFDTLKEASFQIEHHFYTPFHSSWLDLHANQYCLYGVFSRC